MSNSNDPVTGTDGIKVDDVSFDEHGALVGLGDDVLDGIAGGLMDDVNNKGCGNSANVSCATLEN